MLLVRLTYISRIAHTKSEFVDVEKILNSARKHNKNNYVTGILYFNSDCFLQCLEGSRSNVNQTYARILRDKRHKDIQLVNYGEIECREFYEWKMGYAPHSSLTQSTIIQHSIGSELSLYDMSSNSIHRLLLALRDHVPAI